MFYSKIDQKIKLIIFSDEHAFLDKTFKKYFTIKIYIHRITTEKQAFLIYS